MNQLEEVKLKLEMQRGQKAAELLNEELLVEAFDLMNNRLKSEWELSPARDTEGRERLWLMLKLLKNVQDHLQEVLMTGKMASIKLEQERTIKQKMAEYLKSL